MKKYSNKTKATDGTLEWNYYTVWWSLLPAVRWWWPEFRTWNSWPAVTSPLFLFENQGRIPGPMLFRAPATAAWRIGRPVILPAALVTEHYTIIATTMLCKQVISIVVVITRCTCHIHHTVYRSTKLCTVLSKLVTFALVISKHRSRSMRGRLLALTKALPFSWVPQLHAFTIRLVQSSGVKMRYGHLKSGQGTVLTIRNDLSWEKNQRENLDLCWWCLLPSLVHDGDKRSLIKHAQQALNVALTIYT